MSLTSIDDFTYERIEAAEGVSLNLAHGGQGTPVVLLHGFPQTHLMWRSVALALAAEHYVVAPDLRGYGDSDKPPEDGPDTYSKRTMARDIGSVTRHLGFERFAIVGHDRGALVAVRAGLDQPDAVTHLGILDVLPTVDSWDVLRGVEAKVAWHLYLMAQPADLPERMIEAVAEDFFASFLDAWDPSGRTFGDEVRRRYIDASCRAVPSIVADYRASAGIDLEMDRADRAEGRRLSMPVGVISQDWGSLLGFDPTEIWGAWASDLTYQPVDAGHFMAEEDPETIVSFIRGLLGR